MTKYALVVSGKEARTSDGSIMAKEGERFLVTNEPEGWVEASSSGYSGKISKDVKLFESKEAAAKFAKRWEGHPWWCRPNGDFEVIEVVPKYEQRIIGYEKA